jgi:hypothetical protein
LMQGRIWSESPWLDMETGRQLAGSAFHFTVRLATGTAPVFAEPANIAPPPVHAAENGREALQILEKERFDGEGEGPWRPPAHCGVDRQCDAGRQRAVSGARNGHLSG